jgi:hypothetical protein
MAARYRSLDSAYAEDRIGATSEDLGHAFLMLPKRRSTSRRSASFCGASTMTVTDIAAAS